MKKTWIRRLYDAGSALEIRAERLIEKLFGAPLKRARRHSRKK